MIIRLPEDKGILYDSFKYPAGERQVRLKEQVAEDIYSSAYFELIYNFSAEPDIMELVLLTEAVNRQYKGYNSTLTMPYLPYARADRRFTIGDCFGLRAFGQLIDSLDYNYVRTIDVHSRKSCTEISHFVNYSPIKFIEETVKDIHKLPGILCQEVNTPTVTVLLPDKGAADRYKINPSWGTYVLNCDKTRDSKTGKLTGFEVPSLNGCDRILIVDDLCDGGGTFLGIADEIAKQKPDRSLYSLYLYVTHGIFSKGYNELMKKFDKVYTTDSFIIPFESNWLKIYEIDWDSVSGNHENLMLSPKDKE